MVEDVDVEPVELWARLRDHGDAQARERLVLHHGPLARMIAAMAYARRTHGEIEFDDYLQFAQVGLIEAVDRFDPGQDVLFRTFAAKRVRGAVLDGITRLTEKHQQIAARENLRRERLASLRCAATDAPSLDARLRALAEVGVGLVLGILLEGSGMLDSDAWDGGAHAPSPEVGYFRRSEVERLRRLLASRLPELGEQQRQVIRAHYMQGLPFTDIADMMGLTRGRISQIHRQALQRLHALLADAPACDMLA